MSQKNNTLFLGDISIVNDKQLPSALVGNGDVLATGVPIHNSTFEWIENNAILESTNNNNSFYPYTPFNSNIRHFKFDETYRLGVQGQFKNGKWSTPIWLGNDYKVNKRYKTEIKNNNVSVSYISGRYNISSELSE